MKLFLIILLIIVSFTSCGSEGTSVKESKNLSVLEYQNFKEDGLEIINRYRNGAGLTSLKFDNILNKAAQNHATFQIENNLYAHRENGITPRQRLLNLGYKHTDTSENIYAGGVTQKKSVDILFENIYHRLAYLDLGFDEIGFGMGASDKYSWNRVYTYEMGREESRETNELNNPKIVLYPYKDQKDVSPVFYEEVPDPLPECSVSGFPISIQFNPQKNEQISMMSFDLYKDGIQKVESKILPHDGKLSLYEFVLMPLSRLKSDTTYTVKVDYFEGNEEKSISWSFHTKKNPYPTIEVTKDDETIHIQRDKTYYIYMPPKDCNDQFLSYTYTPSKGLGVKERMIDNNTLRIRVDGKGSVLIKLGNGKRFWVMSEV